MLGIDEASFRRGDIERTKETAVGLDGWVYQTLQDSIYV